MQDETYIFQEVFNFVYNLQFYLEKAEVFL